MGSLPRDIMVRIFQLLPIESIVSCKFVSKEWMSAITDPKNLKLYSPNSKRCASFFIDGENLCYLIITQGEGEKSFTNIIENPFLTVHKIPISIKGWWSRPFLGFGQLLNLGPSNGIFCMNSTGDRFLFHNLFTGDSFEVNMDSRIRLGYRSYSWLCYGFGYDRYNDDYKIVALCKPDCKDEVLAWVYSFRNPGWKPSEGLVDFPCYNYAPHSGVYCFNGLLHWLVISVRNSELAMVTMDLNTLKFGLILLPDAVRLANNNSNHPNMEISLAELNGRLCCSYLVFDYKFEVWVMNEYGVPESWEKLVTINHGTGLWESMKPTVRNNLTPLFLYESENGTKVILFGTNERRRLVWYHLNHN